MVISVEDIVRQMMIERGVRNYQIEIEGNSDVSNGYLGDIIFFGVTEYNQEKRNYVLKVAKTDEKLKKVLPIDKINNRELLMYSTIFPKLEQFLNGKCFYNFMDFIPKAWYLSERKNEESIIMDNLKYSNYELCDRKKSIDMAHMKLVFETYGKWHGLAMAFKDQNPHLFSQMEKDLADVKSNMLREFGCRDIYKKEYPIILKLLEDCGKYDLANIFRNLEHKIENITSSNITIDKNDMICIMHGDCWINNYLFKYDKPDVSIPGAVCFIDFQYCAVDSPVADLSAFLYNVGDSCALQNFEDILDVYYNSLAKSMRCLGSDPEQIFTRRDLKRHWKEYAFYGLIASTVYIKLALLDADEAPDIKKIIEDGRSMTEAFNFEIRKMEFVRERLLKSFVHFGEFYINN